MQKYLLIILLSLLSILSYGQFGSHTQVGNYKPAMKPATDIGILAGGSYYIGELNPTQHFNFSFIHFSYGAFYRRYMNKRFAWRLAGYKGKISGDYASTNSALQDINTVAAFESTIIEGSAQIEFTFYDYNPTDNDTYFTPYVFIGLGGFFFSPKSSGADLGNQSSEGGVSYSKRTVNMPLGVGLKFKNHQRFSIGAEWGMRKTFTDYLDNIGDPYSVDFQRGYIYNNDWYSISSLYVSIRLGKKHTTCAAWGK